MRGNMRGILKVSFPPISQQLNHFLHEATACTVFEINDGATLDDGKLKVLESGSHECVVVTCVVSIEFKSREEMLSFCSTCIVRFSGAVSKVLSL